jgi:parvulin-like peptidyl-prolyl isomerase
MKINGQEIDPQRLSSEYHRLVDSQKDRPKELKVSDEELQEIAKKNVTAQVLLTEEARKQFPTVKPEEVKKRAKQLQKQFGPQFKPEDHREEMEDDIRVQKLLEQTAEGSGHVSEDEAREAFDQNPERWQTPEQVHVSHIVRHTFGGADPNQSLTQIMEAQSLIKQGQPFEAVAQRFSDQHGQAGDLGTFARGSMVEKFENVVFRMKPGEISDVFQTEFGYHIALVHEKTEAKERSFDEAKADVTRELRSERERSALDSLIERLREAATIEE